MKVIICTKTKTIKLRHLPRSEITSALYHNRCNKGVQFFVFLYVSIAARIHLVSPFISSRVLQMNLTIPDHHITRESSRPLPFDYKSSADNFKITNIFANAASYQTQKVIELHFFYKQLHFRVEPRVAIKIPKMRIKVAMKLLSIFGIEAQGC